MHVENGPKMRRSWRTIALLDLHLLPGLERLLYQPLHYGEDAHVVQALDLVRLEAQRASQLWERRHDLFRQRATLGERDAFGDGERLERSEKDRERERGTERKNGRTGAGTERKRT